MNLNYIEPKYIKNTNPSYDIFAYIREYYNVDNPHEANILNINEQSLKNKISDMNRKFSIEDIILISKATNYSLDQLVFKDLEMENK